MCVCVCVYSLGPQISLKIKVLINAKFYDVMETTRNGLKLIIHYTKVSAAHLR